MCWHNLCNLQSGFVNFCGAGRGGAKLAFRGPGRASLILTHLSTSLPNNLLTACAYSELCEYISLMYSSTFDNKNGALSNVSVVKGQVVFEILLK